jgi:hypothetical protein
MELLREAVEAAEAPWHVLMHVALLLHTLGALTILPAAAAAGATGTTLAVKLPGVLMLARGGGPR